MPKCLRVRVRCFHVDCQYPLDYIYIWKGLRNRSQKSTVMFKLGWISKRVKSSAG